jgi:hypothetical protein
LVYNSLVYKGNLPTSGRWIRIDPRSTSGYANAMIPLLTIVGVCFFILLGLGLIVIAGSVLLK